MNVAGLCPLTAEEKKKGLDRYNLFPPSLNVRLQEINGLRPNQPEQQAPLI